jgi:hypothetical protein
LQSGQVTVTATATAGAAAEGDSSQGGRGLSTTEVGLLRETESSRSLSASLDVGFVLPAGTFESSAKGEKKLAFVFLWDGKKYHYRIKLY